MSKEFPFSKLNEDAKLVLCTRPYSVSVTKNPDDENSEQIRKRQEKFLILPEPVKDKLVTDLTAQKIQNIGKSFHLEPLQMADISRAIRSYYFQELKLSDFPANLSKEIGINIATAQKISDLVIQRIINDSSQEKAYAAQIESLPIENALKKYPLLGEQLITANYIKIRTYPEPVRPSIDNWLSDYTFTIGISNHDPIIRGNYLFKSDNTQTLSFQDRERLSALIKSFEDKTPLSINSNSKQIIFNIPEKEEVPRKPIIDLGNINSTTEPAEIRRGQNQTNNYPKQRITQPAPKLQPDEKRISAWRRDLPKKETAKTEPETGNIHFSSPQTLPIEKPIETLHPPRLSFPQASQVTKINYSTPPRPLPKNVVNLKEE
ncbi:MAG: hypothetical protein WC848_01910 [Parcubacteria group bacterium]|jgi:hypothetical protein